MKVHKLIFCLLSVFGMIFACSENYFHNFLLYNSTAYIPILSSHDLETTDPNILNVVVAIHGYTEDVEFSFCSMVAALGKPKLRHVMVISPWFFRRSIPAREWDNSRQDDDTNISSLFWHSNSSWMVGGDARLMRPGVNGRHSYVRYSSYDVLDSIYYHFSARRHRFPALTGLVYSGFSAGGQMINRYSWATDVGLDRTQGQLPVRFICSDASSYLYLDSHRPTDECLDRPFLQQSIGGAETWQERSYVDMYSCTSFAAVTKEQQHKCHEIDQWKYGTGISSLGTTVDRGYSYLLKLGEVGMVQRLSELWVQKDVRYVFGSRDTCNCYIDNLWRKQQQRRQTEMEELGLDDEHGMTKGDKKTDRTQEKDVVNFNGLHCYVHCKSSVPVGNCSTPSSYSHMDKLSSKYACHDTFPDSLNNDLSVACGADVQGRHRLQRGLLYMSYLRWYYSPSQTHAHLSTTLPYEPIFAVVAGLQHDMPLFYSSDVFRDWAFEPFPLTYGDDDPATTSGTIAPVDILSSMKSKSRSDAHAQEATVEAEEDTEGVVDSAHTEITSAYKGVAVWLVAALGVVLTAMTFAYRGAMVRRQWESMGSAEEKRRLLFAPEQLDSAAR